MIILLLALALTAHTLPIVDHCEINQTPGVRQVILWRFTHLSSGHSHRVAQWWIISRDPLVTRRDGLYVVRSEGREFLARRVDWTQTPRDPELADRDALGEDQRRGYLLDCE